MKPHFFKKLLKPRSAGGVGITDVIISLVVAAIISVIIYNIYKKNQSKKQAQYVSSYLHSNADLALRSITNDLMKSAIYSAGCHSAGLLKPKYGGISSPDEITILTSDSLSTEFLQQDMKSENSPLFTPLGTPYRIGERLAICDDFNMDWFTVSQISHKENEGLTVLIPELVEGYSPFSTGYQAGAVVGSFEKARYFIKSEDDKSSLMLDLGGSEKTIANDIENLKFEYYIQGSDVAILEPSDPFLIRSVKISVVARSKNQDPYFSGGINSLTGEVDGYKRLTAFTKVDFDPINVKRVRDLEFRIIKDKTTQEDMPLIAEKEKKADEE